MAEMPRVLCLDRRHRPVVLRRLPHVPQARQGAGDGAPAPPEDPRHPPHLRRDNAGQVVSRRPRRAGPPAAPVRCPRAPEPGIHLLVLVGRAGAAIAGRRQARRPGPPAMSALAPTLQSFFTERLAPQRPASPPTIPPDRDTLPPPARHPGGAEATGGYSPPAPRRGCEPPRPSAPTAATSAWPPEPASAVRAKAANNEPSPSPAPPRRCCANGHANAADEPRTRCSPPAQADG